MAYLKFLLAGAALLSSASLNAANIEGWQIRFAQIKQSSGDKSAACVLVQTPQENVKLNTFCRYQIERPAYQAFFRDDTEGQIFNSRGLLNTSASQADFIQKISIWLNQTYGQAAARIPAEQLAQGFEQLSKTAKTQGDYWILELPMPDLALLNYGHFALNVHSFLQQIQRQQAGTADLRNEQQTLSRLNAQLQEQAREALQQQQSLNSLLEQQRTDLTAAQSEIKRLQEQLKTPTRTQVEPTAPAEPVASASTPKSTAAAPSVDSMTPQSATTPSNALGLAQNIWVYPASALALFVLILLIVVAWLYSALRKQHDKLGHQVTGEFAAVQDELEKVKLFQTKIRALQEELVQSTTLEANAAWVLLEEIKDKFVPQTHDKMIINKEKDLAFIKRLKEDVEDAYNRLAALTKQSKTCSFQEHIEFCEKQLQNTLTLPSKQNTTKKRPPSP